MRPLFKIMLHSTPNRDGTRSVFLRVTYNRKRKYFSLDRKCMEKDWDEKAGRFRRSFPEYRRENETLDGYEDRAREIWRDMERDNVAFTFDRFERARAGHRVGVEVSLQGFFAERIEGMKEEGKSGNASVYEEARKRLLRFRPGATLADVDGSFVGAFMRFLRKDGRGVGYLHLRCLRAVCNAAKKEGVMPRSWEPFEGVDLPKARREGGQRALTLEHLRLLELQPPSLALDLFLFSFYTRGTNLADLALMRPENVQGGRLVYVRRKTGKAYSVPLKGRAAEIWQRYAGQGGAYVFPIYSEIHFSDQQKRDRLRKVAKQVNRALRTLAGVLGVPAEDLSFYSARHTYATALKSKGVSSEVIREALGHSDLGTTENYLRRFDDSVLDKADELLS